MKTIIALVTLAGIIVLGFSIYRLYLQKKDLRTELNSIKDDIGPLGRENNELVAEIKYFQDDDNLEKELRSRFNYIHPNEKLIMVIPESQKSQP